MNKWLILFFKAILLLIIVGGVFYLGSTNLKPSKEMAELMLQIMLVFTGFGLLAYSININSDERESEIKNIRKTLGIEFRMSAIFGVFSILSIFSFLMLDSSHNLYNLLFYVSSILSLLGVVSFLAPLLEYNLFD
ncbi:MAG: hypothetical protein OQK82_08275 [Candidatus Pacearchaeota archaeon]|nr:hypothetical protein [Candidatus Pacearchaeota archaeon]